MSRKAKWTDYDKDFVKENAATMIDEELAKALSKASGKYFTMKAVRLQRQSMGIAKKNGRGVCGLVDK